MSDENKKYAIRPMERILTSMRSRFGTKPAHTKEFDISVKQQSVISKQELAMLKSRSHSTPLTLGTVRNNIQSVSSNIASKIEDTSEMMVMLPELRKARRVLIPSIMSPTDMHGSNLIVNVDVPGLEDSDIANKIQALVSTYINTDLKLGKSISDWIGDALFKTGATPVMVVPKSIMSIIGDNQEVSEEHLTQYGKDSISKPNTSLLLLQPDAYVSSTELTKSTEALFASHEAVFSTGKQKKKPAKDTINKYTQKVTKNLKDNLVVSADFTMMIQPDETKRKSDKLEDSIVNILTKTSSGNILSMSSNKLADADNEPNIIKLPTTSCIPIIIPGVESEHLGYFVALDEHGTPLHIKSRKENNQLLESENDFISTMTVLKNNTSKSSIDASRQLADAMFELSIKEVLEKAVNNIGLAGVDLPDKNKLFSAIFSRIMAGKKVNMIFVPRSMLAYYAFDFREDGTGKPVVEDISFIVAMRTSFLLARVLSTINNAIDQKKISFSMEDQLSSNVDQIMAAMNDAFLEKYMYRFDHNPMEATRNLVSRSLSIQPSDMAGVHNLNIDTSTEQRQASIPDDALEERLTKMAIMCTDVPPSVLDEVGENEFSRSIAASHIMFSNAIRDYQDQVSTITNILVRALLRYSTTLRAQIDALIKDVKIEKDDNENEVNDFLEYVISKITITLPPPNVAPDKSKFEEMSTIVDAVESVFDKLFAEELVAIDDDELKSTLSAIKASAMRTAIKEVVANLGGIDMATIATFDDDTFEPVKKYNKQLINYGAAMKRMKSVFLASGEDDDNGY